MSIEPRLTGVLLVNVGTPEAPRAAETRVYLREFLGDPRVLDLSRLGRFLLLEGVILPFRPRRSAEAYASIWTDEGSPLLVHGRAFARGLSEALGAGWRVHLAMRYGAPSMRDAFDAFRREGIDRVVVFPLYPQRASATTGTTLAHAFTLAGARWNVPTLSSVPAFFDDPGFLDAFTAVGKGHLESARADHVLFSFHGLPERQIRRADEGGSHCLEGPACCDVLGPSNRGCYRAQCFATARALADRAGLAPDGWTISFQSRLGRDPWVKPYTDLTVRELAARGVRRLAVFCPAFVADCLETLEEIGLRAREDFLLHGGEELILVPSLGAHPAWIAAAAALVRAASPNAR